jgi:hypothetical protein
VHTRIAIFVHDVKHTLLSEIFAGCKFCELIENQLFAFLFSQKHVGH